MIPFSSILSGVSSEAFYESLITLRKDINTCFEYWRRKFLQLETNYNKHSNISENLPKLNLNFQLQLQNSKEYQILKKTNENQKNYNRKLLRAFALKYQKPRKNQDTCLNKIEIIAKLLSTIVLNQQNFNKNYSNSFIKKPFTKFFETASSSNRMTIMEDTFLLIREEFPDLDAEVRGILLARAQTGATIGQIKEDYRKNTGLQFPVYDNITDFLLCIPGVMAFCTEQGTRIFSVQPNEKNKHIYDLVMNQKAPSEPSANNNRRDSRPFENNNINTYPPIAAPSIVQSAPVSWRSNNFSRPVHSSLSLQQEHQQPYIYYQQHNMEQPNLRSASDGLMEQRNGFYRDNCQHLYSRIYHGNEQNKANDSWSTNENFNMNFNNLNTNRNPTPIADSNTLNRESLPFSGTNNQNHVFRRPIGRPMRAIQTSSPSGTRTSGASGRTYDSLFSTDLEYEAHLLDFPLLGDDFLLYLARMELKCKFKKYEKVLQSGLCVSGQTIKAATRRVSRLPFITAPNRRIIVNIGSVDIMQGKPLVQIEHDYRNLINIINKRGMQPILTTLAPLANYSHDASMKNKLERFNEFIKREGQLLLVIDIWARFVNEKKQTLFDCYQNEPRQVTGAKESYVFWNKIGRQRVLQLIESKLEY